MPSDFGDESGEKLFDWILKVGQDASEAAMLESVEKLKTAFKNARGAAGDETAVSANSPADKSPEWGKLRLAEFESLPEYQTIKEAIDERLHAEAIEHDFFVDEKGGEFLLFKIEQAPLVQQAFKDLEEKADAAFDRVLEERGKKREQIRDEEPLEQRAAHARDASREIENAREKAHEVELSELRSK